MPRARRVAIENACYHIITRGNQKQAVFLEEKDYEVYLSILKRYKKGRKFKLFGFCLMPNHVHILMEVNDPTSLSKVMKCINLSYTLYFNSKYEKVGHLWQDRFKSKVIEKDSYLLECMNYIENNPVMASLVNEACEYPWSSLRLRGLENNILDNLYI